MDFKRLLIAFTACLSTLTPAFASEQQTAVLSVPTVVVLQYHHISDSTPRATSTSPALFRQQMETIKALGLKVAPLGDALQKLESGKIDDRLVVITFDDAYRSVFEVARPILKEFGYPYTVFVNTDAVDRNQPDTMDWNTLRQLAREKVIIANHSTDHQHFLKIAGESDDAQRTRIKSAIWNAHQRIVNEIGIEPRFFAFPYGEFDAATAAIVASYRYIMFGQHSGPIGADMIDTPLPRYSASNAYGALPSFKEKLLSLPFPITTRTNVSTIAESNPPTLTLDLNSVPNANQLKCYTSGPGVAKIRWEGLSAKVTATKALANRRERYNCTLRSDSGRYYWLSQPWFRPDVVEATDTYPN